LTPKCTADKAPVPKPTPKQVRVAREVVRWYLLTHHARGDAPGSAAMFCDPAKVGAFAADRAALAAGEATALFRVLVATAMFQRRQDQQILRILRGMPAASAAEITDANRLRSLARRSPCPYVKTVGDLRERCDLTKHPTTGRGVCSAQPTVACHLKLHTVVLKRYGHFGKVPTSIALSLEEGGARDLPGLFRKVIAQYRTRLARAVALETALCEAWRVNQKIASMFLSAITNPDLSPGHTVPWAERIDWTYFVVVDSNVDLFLASIGYRGPSSYDARRAFVTAIAARIDLRRLSRHIHASNPRIVQQAMYLFMSAANRRTLVGDCSHLGPLACRRCPPVLANRCGLNAIRPQRAAPNSSDQAADDRLRR
jgi:hypothetical protein